MSSYTDFDPSVLDSGSESVAESEFFESGPGTMFEEGEFLAPENWIAWSADGAAWNFQRSAEAFGLAEGEDAWTQVAVGDGYVIAMLESFAESEGGGSVTFEGDGDFFPTIRWFLAETG